MKGLILKDLYNLFRYSKTLLFLGLFFSVSGIIQKNVSFLTGMIVLMATMMVITSFSCDDMAKWDKYALSMPVTRTEIVLSKYLLTGIMILSGTIISVALGIGASLFVDSIIVTELLLGIGGSVIAAIIIISILIPSIYKFGVEKSRLIMLTIAFIPTMIVIILGNMGVNPPSTSTIETILRFSPFVAAAAIVISYLVSCKIYTNKEI